MFLFLIEMACWGLRTSYLEHRRWVWWISEHTPQDPILMLLLHFGKTLNRTDTGKFTKAGRKQVKRILEWWEKSGWTDHVNVLLRAVEVENSIWWVIVPMILLAFRNSV